MNKRVIHRFVLSLLLALLLTTRPAAAFIEDWYFRTGINGNYSSGVAPENLYLKPFAEGGFVFPVVEIIPGFYRYQGYQVTDGSGNYRLLNYNQAGLEVIFNPISWIDIGAGYRHSAGEYDYRGNEFFGDLSLHLGKTDVSLSGSNKTSEYEFNGILVKTENRIFSGEVNFYINGKGSFDGGIEHTSLEYSSISSAYTTIRGHLGFSLYPGKGSIITASCSYGYDSADYQIFGAGVSAKLGLGSYISVFVIYQFAYYLAPVSAGDSTGTHGPGSGSTPRGTNPFIKSSLVGENYWSQTAVLGISIKL